VNALRICTKWFLTNMLIVLLLLGSLTYLMNNYSREIIYSKIQDNSRYSVSQLALNIDHLLLSYEQTMDFLFTNDNMQERLLADYDSFADAQAMYFETVDSLIRSLRGSREIDRFVFYSENPLFGFAGFRLIDDRVKRTDWYTAFQSNPRVSKIWWPPIEDPYTHKGIYRLTQRLNNLKAGAQLYVTMDLDVRLFYNLIASENASHRFIAALPNGSVLMDSHRREAYENHLQDYWIYEYMGQSEAGSVRVTKDHSDYLLIYQTLSSRSSVRGLKVVSLIPMDELLTNANEMQRIAILLFVAAMVVSLLLIYGLSLGLTKRLTKLASAMQNMNMEQLQPIVDMKGNDEVNALVRMFNGMIDRIDKLIRDVYQSEINRQELELRTKESELYALQTQINPHYLFNTLTAIRGSLLEKGDDANAEMIKLLAHSFRHVLGKSGQLIRLSEELETVDTYLRIQSFRFAGRFRYDIAVPEALKRYAIPRLSLQTLVENAIIHALERSEKATVLAIRAEVLNGAAFTVSVEDNGPGIAPEELALIMERLNEPSQPPDEKRIGLRNVHQRLRRTFGPAYGLLIESEEGSGTKVCVVLPAEAC